VHWNVSLTLPELAPWISPVHPILTKTMSKANFGKRYTIIALAFYVYPDDATGGNPNHGGAGGIPPDFVMAMFR